LFPSIGFPYAFYTIIANYVLCFGGGFLVLLGVIAQAAHMIVNAIYRQQEAILAVMAWPSARSPSIAPAPAVE
jgi:hypothetical protein